MERKQAIMMLFNGIMDCYKIELKMTKLAKLPELTTETMRQMNEFLKFDFKTISITLLSKLYDKHVLYCRILNELI